MHSKKINEEASKRKIEISTKVLIFCEEKGAVGISILQGAFSRNTRGEREANE